MGVVKREGEKGLSNFTTGKKKAGIAGLFISVAALIARAEAPAVGPRWPEQALLWRPELRLAP